MCERACVFVYVYVCVCVCVCVRMCVCARVYQFHSASLQLPCHSLSVRVGWCEVWRCEGGGCEG